MKLIARGDAFGQLYSDVFLHIYMYDSEGTIANGSLMNDEMRHMLFTTDTILYTNLHYCLPVRPLDRLPKAIPSLPLLTK